MEIFGRGGNIKKQEINAKKISGILSGKTYSDENFPVSSFIMKRDLGLLIKKFYFFARTADDVADNEKLSSKEKKTILNFFDRTLGNSEYTDLKALNDLIYLFPKIPFGKKYSRHLLKAFLLDAHKKEYKDWDELLYYCKYSANPVGRFVIDASHQNQRKNKNLKKIYRESDKLCSALQIINHLQDCKDDYLNLKRIYIPESFFKKYGLNTKCLSSKESPKKFIKLKLELVKKVEDMLINTKQGLKLIRLWRLRKETLIILNIAKRLCNLLKKYDPLEKKIKLSRIDLIFCFIKGIIWD